MATEEEYHEFDDSDDEEGEEENAVVDITDIKSTPSKALRPSTYKDRVFIIHTGKYIIKQSKFKNKANYEYFNLLF